ncbi:MAG: hypothetical protein AB1758_00995 [Candidatus Eremiobacterota bacterium]
MSGYSPVERLVAEWRTLEKAWLDTRSRWRDSVGDRFTREHWERFEREVPTFGRALDEVLEQLDEAIRELEAMEDDR